MLLPRTRFQLLATLRPGPSAPQGALLAAVVDSVVGWIGERLGGPLPAAAYAVQSFEAESPGCSVRAVAIPERGLWAARLVEVEADAAATPVGRWTHDVALAESEAAIGIRSTFAPASPTAEPLVERPELGLLRALAARFELREAGRLDGVPRTLANAADLDRLHALLTDPSRRLPVYVLTRPSEGALGVA